MSREQQRLAMVVGANIAALRVRKQMTQTELGSFLGMGADQLSRIERGIVAPRFNRLELFASVLGCSVADLFMTNLHEERVKQPPLSPQEEILVLSDRVCKLARQIISMENKVRISSNVCANKPTRRALVRTRRQRGKKRGQEG